MAAYDGVIKIKTEIVNDATEASGGKLKTLLDAIIKKQKDHKTEINKTSIAAAGVNSAFKSLLATLGRLVTITALVSFAKQSLELASSITEVDNVVNKAFGDMRDQMDALAETSIEELGISRLTAYQTGSTFMSMGKSMLNSAEDASEMAIALTKLSANMASFYNIEQDAAATALKSIYTGETETLKQYGIVMTEVNLKEFALAQGIEKSYSEMTQAEKVALRYNYVLAQTAFIGEDFKDTSDSWANQTRILSEQWKEFMSVVGTGLISVLTPVVKMLNNLVKELINVANTINTVMSSIFGVKMQDTGADSATSEYEDATEAADDYTEAAENAKNANNGFDELNLVNDTTTSTDTTGAGVELAAYESAAAEIENTEVTPTWLDTLKEKLDPIIEAFENLGTSLEPFKEAIGPGLQTFYDEVLTPLGTWASDVIVKALDDLSAAVDLVKGSLDVATPLLQSLYDDCLKPLGEFVGDTIIQILDDIGNALKWIADNEVATTVLIALATAIGVIASVVLIYTAAMKIASIATAAFNIAMTILTSPITLIIVAIAALIAIGILLANHWDEIKAKALEVWTAIKDFFIETWETLKEKVTEVWTGVKDFFTETWTAIKDKVTEVWDGIKEKITDTFTNIVDGITKSLNRIKLFWTNIWTSLKNTVVTVFDGIWSKIKTIVNSILGGIEKMVNGLVKGVNKMINALNTLNIDVPDWVTDITGISNFGFNIPNVNEVSIPRLANGGITTGSTLANIGEAGREAILPLQNNIQYMEPLAEMINSKIGSGIIPYLQTLVNSNEEIAAKDLTIGDDAIRKAYLRASKNSGVSIIS